MKNGFFRGHGLGNDYLVMDPKELTFKLTTPKTSGPSAIAIGDSAATASWRWSPQRKRDFGLRIFNPDGSEAEKSGNGLRIFARYLHATGKTKKDALYGRDQRRAGHASRCISIGMAMRRAATVEMGRATFQPAASPVRCRCHELIQQPIEAAGRSLHFTGVSVGNPHCVVFKTGRRILVAGGSLDARTGTGKSFPVSQTD